MEGNTLIDCWKEPRRGTRCAWCNGTGNVKWTEAKDGVARYIDAVDMFRYRKEKAGQAMTFKDLLKVARIIRKEGCDCHACDGTGEAYND